MSNEEHELIMINNNNNLARKPPKEAGVPARRLAGRPARCGVAAKVGSTEAGVCQQKNSSGEEDLRAVMRGEQRPEHRIRWRAVLSQGHNTCFNMVFLFVYVCVLIPLSLLHLFFGPTLILGWP